MSRADEILGMLNQRGFQLRETRNGGARPSGDEKRAGIAASGPSRSPSTGPVLPFRVPESSPERKQRIAGWTAKIVPELRELAKRRREFGVVADDARHIAQEHGIFPGKEQRAWSWLAAVAPAAGLIATNDSRYNAQRNKQTVFVHPDYAP